MAASARIMPHQPGSRAARFPARSARPCRARKSQRAANVMAEIGEPIRDVSAFWRSGHTTREAITSESEPKADNYDSGVFLMANAGALSAAVALSAQMSLLLCRRNADEYNVI